MRIIYIVNSLRKSGPVNVLYGIVRGLPVSEYEVHIIKLSEDEPSRSMTKEFCRIGAKVWELHHSVRYLELATWYVRKQVGKILEQVQPDIVHTHGYHPVLVVSQLKRWMRVETLHCICKEDFVFSKGKLLGSYMVMRYLHALRKMNHAAGISKAVCRAYEPIMGEERVTLVYNGCDTNVFYPLTPSQRQKFRLQYNVKEKEIIYVVVGTLSQGKNPLLIIDAFVQLHKEKKLSSVRLWFVGKGPLFEICQERAKECPFIYFWGYKTNVTDYVRMADFEICASRSEGFGLNYVEALIANVPVVGSDIPPFQEFTEMIPQLRKIQFKSDDLEDLKRAILASQKIRLERAVIGQQARAIFSTERMASDYLKLYCKLLSNHR